MNYSLQNFMLLPIDLMSLALLLLEMFPKYDNTVVSSNFGTAVTIGLWRDMLLKLWYAIVNKFHWISIFAKCVSKCFNLKMKFKKMRNNIETPMW